MKTKLVIILVFLGLAKLIAQNTSLSVEVQALDFFEKSYYKESLELLTKYENNNTLSPRGLFLKALNLYQLNRLNSAEENLFKLLNDQQQVPFAEVWLYLGKVKHHQNEFEEAAKHYKTYLRTVKADEELKNSIIEEIRRCSNGRKVKYSISGNFVENLGSQVNSSEDEFYPIESERKSAEVYFSTMSGKNKGGKREETGKINEWEGRFYADMYRSVNNGGSWISPQPLHFLLNGPQHEVLIGFGQEEQTLYFFRGNSLIGGEIMRTSYSESNDLEKKTNTFYRSPWLNIKEGGLQVINRNTVLFAARIPGGYGGLDLYYSLFSEGQWSEPINLGSEINTAYDEAYPFLARDGKTLFYSSNNSEWSIGGYDILYQVYDNQKWSLALSMGMPINSVGDDIQFYLARDRYTGYFTSKRRTGFGKMDLYVTYLGNAINEEKDSFPLFIKLPKRELVVKAEETTSKAEVQILEKPLANQANKTASSKETSGQVASKREEIAGEDQIVNAKIDQVEVGTKTANSKETNGQVASKREEIVGEDQIVNAKIDQVEVETKTASSKETSGQVTSKREEIAGEDQIVNAKIDQAEVGTKRVRIEKVEEKSIELSVVIRSIEREAAEILKEILKEFREMQNGNVHLTFSVRSRVPLFEQYTQVEQSANQIVQYLIGLGIPTDRIAFRIELNATIPQDKFQMKYSWKDGSGLPLNPQKTISEDPFSMRAMESPFYYKVSLSGASELKNAALINNYPQPTLEVDPEGKKTFNAGKFRTFESAERFAQQLINNGLSELKVVPYVYDYMVEDKNIKQFMHLFPDFSVYLNRNK